MNIVRSTSRKIIPWPATMRPPKGWVLIECETTHLRNVFKATDGVMETPLQWDISRACKRAHDFVRGDFKERERSHGD